jgi:hypothetical protein
MRASHGEYNALVHLLQPTGDLDFHSSKLDDSIDTSTVARDRLLGLQIDVVRAERRFFRDAVVRQRSYVRPIVIAFENAGSKNFSRLEEFVVPAAESGRREAPPTITLGREQL